MIVISKHLLRLSAVLVVAVGASACSSIPDWVDPTTWGSDQQASVPPEDQSGNQTATDQNGEGKTVAEASDTGAAYPTLADTPDHAPQTTSSDDQKQVASGLVADRSQTQYSGDALRGGTEAAAPPPGPAPTAEQVAAAEAQASAPDSSSAQASAAAPAGPDTDAAPNPNSTIDANPDQAPAPTATAQAATPDMSANTQVAAVEQPTAPTAPPPSSNAEPAVPAIAPGSTAAAPMASADASLGFHRSSAPPLDPSIAQFVPPSVLSRYQQTASEGAVPGIGSAPASASYAAMPKRARTARHKTLSENVGGPEAMSGAVVANFESLQSSPAKSAAVYSDPRGVPPAEVVFFPHDTTVLNAQGREQVRQAVEAFRAHGGQGFIRVVGHSSSRTANMTVERHMVYNFERSQARANSVARALIAAGVPADKVLVEAVGDTQPVYYESMPQGEEGNRRAEIFLQS